MQKTKRFSSLSITQLARMEDAGITHVVRALTSLIQTGSTLSDRLYQLINYLRAGQSIAESGFRTGLFNELDRELIEAGEYSGRLGDLYRQLANYYGDKARHIRKIKSQLFFR